MAWVYASDATEYDGPVHVLAGTTYSGATRTPESRRLIEVPDAPKPKTAAEKRKARPKTIIEE